MSYEEIIKELNKQNVELGAELEIVKNKLQDTEYLLNREIERLHSIIKEVREYIEEHTKYKNYGYIDQKQWLDKYFDLRNLKEILEKESKEWDT